MLPWLSWTMSSVLLPQLVVCTAQAALPQGKSEVGSLTHNCPVMWEKDISKQCAVLTYTPSPCQFLLCLTCWSVCLNKQSLCSPLPQQCLWCCDRGYSSPGSAGDTQHAPGFWRWVNVPFYFCLFLWISRWKAGVLKSLDIYIAALVITCKFFFFYSFVTFKTDYCFSCIVLAAPSTNPFVAAPVAPATAPTNPFQTNGRAAAVAATGGVVGMNVWLRGLCGVWWVSRSLWHWSTT